MKGVELAASRDVCFRACAILALTVLAVGFAFSQPEATPSGPGSVFQGQRSNQLVLGLSPDDVTAYSTLGLALLTFVLAGVGLAQVYFLKRADLTARRSADVALIAAQAASKQADALIGVESRGCVYPK